MPLGGFVAVVVVGEEAVEDVLLYLSASTVKKVVSRACPIVQ